MAINTVPLTSAPNVPPGAAIAGAAVPAVNHIPIEKKAFRFEVREVVDKANGVFNTLPGSGQTLNAMAINNNIPFQRLAMTEHQQTTLCSPLTDDIHVAYTVYHPHLAASSISIVSNNNGAYSVSLVDAPIPFAGNTNPALTSINDPAVPVPNSGANTLHRCTYIVTLSVTPRLHNGDSASLGHPHPDLVPRRALSTEPSRGLVHSDRPPWRPLNPRAIRSTTTGWTSCCSSPPWR